MAEDLLSSGTGGVMVQLKLNKAMVAALAVRRAARRPSSPPAAATAGCC